MRARSTAALDDLRAAITLACQEANLGDRKSIRSYPCVLMTAETKNSKPMSVYVIDDHPLMREAVVMLHAPPAARRERGRTRPDRRRRSRRQAARRARPDLPGPEAAGHHRHLGHPRDEEALSRRRRSRCCRLRPRPTPKSSASRPARTSTSKSPRAPRKSAMRLRALLTADGGFEELAPTDNKLSKRQKQLIVMLDRGLSNREIADELGISEHTVKVHLWRLFRRLGREEPHPDHPLRSHSRHADQLGRRRPRARSAACCASVGWSIRRNTVPCPGRDDRLSGWPRMCDSRATMYRPRPKPSSVPAWLGTL